MLKIHDDGFSFVALLAMMDRTKNQLKIVDIFKHNIHPMSVTFGF